jgi:hypothetical protein
MTRLPLAWRSSAQHLARGAPPKPLPASPVTYRSTVLQVCAAVLPRVDQSRVERCVCFSTVEASEANRQPRARRLSGFPHARQYSGFAGIRAGKIVGSEATLLA